MEALHIIEPKVNQDTYKLLTVKQNNVFPIPGILQSENTVTPIMTSFSNKPFI